MTLTAGESNPNKWSLLQRIFFRFFFVYFMLNISPWSWLDNTVPGINYVTEYYDKAISWITELFNRLWFHFEKTNIVNNGSGDTSENWEMIYTFFILAVAGTLLWSILDRKRKSYIRANYWLLTFTRYYVIINCFIYGIIKLYCLQMIFPNQSQLATPLGDLLPMRFAWMFIGYSSPYQMFSGAMEVLAGVLLLNRRTITLGLFIATAVFVNVMVLNLSYDIPVKLFSIHLVLFCLYLMLNDSKRLVDFFIFNRAGTANTLHQLSFPKKWMRVTRIILKLAFIALFVVKPLIETRDRHRSFYAENNTKPIAPGIYDVTVFAVNKDTIPPLVTDTLRWRDLIFEKSGLGSVGSTDTAFRQRYRRGYFSFIPDTAQQTIVFKKTAAATSPLYKFHYAFPDSNTIQLRGSRNKDSVFVVLKKSMRHFQLAEKQFHWISEANR